MVKKESVTSSHWLRRVSQGLSSSTPVEDVLLALGAVEQNLSRSEVPGVIMGQLLLELSRRGVFKRTAGIEIAAAERVQDVFFGETRVPVRETLLALIKDILTQQEESVSVKSLVEGMVIATVIALEGSGEQGFYEKLLTDAGQIFLNEVIQELYQNTDVYECYSEQEELPDAQV